MPFYSNKMSRKGRDNQKIQLNIATKQVEFTLPKEAEEAEEGIPMSKSQELSTIQLMPMSTVDL